MKLTDPRLRWLYDFLLTAACLALATVLCTLLRQIDDGSGYYVSLIFVLAVACISRWTEGYFWGIFSAVSGVLFVNYVFTYPYWELNFTITGYPLTFLAMLAVSLMISTMNTKIKKQEKLRIETEKEAVRANLLRAMSHDIRTPLTSIVGNTAAILDNGDSFSPEQKRRLLQDVNDDAQWLIRMVENLLSITRMSNGQAKIEKDWRNDANRKTNCDTANVTKAVDAAQEQLAALRTLEAQGRLDTLPEKLLQTALLRREHPEATLSELAELHEPPTSKSTVNHRMRKLLALAAEGTETTEEGPA